MSSISPSSVLTAVVVAVLLCALPGSILRIIHTGNLYLFTHDFFADLLARLSGPGKMRFILQPTVAIVLGARDGIKDARGGLPPFIHALAFHRAHRSSLLRNMFASVRDLVAIAILLDVVAQYLIFHEIHPGAAVLLGPVLIALPYTLSRASTNRIARRRISQTLSTPQKPV
jgi:hypothetical protein